MNSLIPLQTTSSGLSEYPSQSKMLGSYQDNTSFVKRLKQEESPDMSEEQAEEAIEEYEPSDNKFLEELELENQMLEKELESLIQMKHQALQDTTKRTKPEEFYQTIDIKNLHRIEEIGGEVDGDYSYSNSEDDEDTEKKNKKRLKDEESTNTGSDIPNVQIKNEDIKELLPNQRILNNDFLLPNSPKHISVSPKKGRDLIKDKENYPNNKSRSGITYQGRTSSETKKGNNSPQRDKVDKMQSLECRLAGANKAIRSLEKELKLKEEKVQDLLRELDKKNKLMELQQGSGIQLSVNQKTTQVKESLTNILRKKEKSLEKKVKDQDIIIEENKKYMSSLQNLNAKLLAKIKKTEEENNELKQPFDQSELVKTLEEEKKKLAQRVKELESQKQQTSNLLQDMEKQYLVALNKYSDVEEKSELFLKKNKVLNDSLLHLIGLFYKQDKSRKMNNLNEN